MVRKKAKRIHRLDLSDVENNKIPVPEGNYHVSVISVEEEEGPKGPYFAWRLKIESKKQNGRTLYLNTSLLPQSLFNLRGVLDAMEVEIPDEPFDLDLDEMVGGEFMVSVDEDTWEGKPKARVTDWWPMKGKPKGDEEDEEEEKPAPKKKKPVEDDEEEDEAPKRSKRSAKVEDDEDEEEDEPPKRSKKGSSKKPKPPTQAEIKDMSQDELEDVIKELDLDVDLSELKSLRKMQLAVIDELEG